MSQRLTSAMRRMLVSLRDTGDPYAHCKGRSEYGGASGTLTALIRRGLATGYPNMVQITEAGCAAIQTEGSTK